MIAYILKSLSFNRRLHLGTVSGAAVVCAVMVGALLVGDSARHTLRQLALERLGRTGLALTTGGRFVKGSLAADMESATGTVTVPFLHTTGVLLIPGGRPGKRESLNGVQVLGVEASFGSLVPEGLPEGYGERGGPFQPPPPGGAYLDRRSAVLLGVSEGDEIILRISLPGFLPRDAPLSSRRGRGTRSYVLKITAILPGEFPAGFNLENVLIPPRNLFVDLEWLQGAMGREGKVNGILIPEGGPSLQEARSALSRVLKLDHAGLSLREDGSKGMILTSSRIFMEKGLSQKFLALPGSRGSLHYLVNEITRVNGVKARSTPYSFLAAVSPSSRNDAGPVPPEMSDSGIVLNSWIAERLEAGIGDEVTVRYFQLTPTNHLAERTRVLKVVKVVPIESLASERAAVPSYPGLTDVEMCRDWEVGIPMDETKLADPDNQLYWEKHRATPKGFVTLAAGRALWGNRFGDLTAIRFPAAGRSPEDLALELEGLVSPEDLGLVFHPVRKQALEGVRSSMDLGDLFLGLGSFLILSSLILTALLFSLGTVRRLPELGTLLSLGFSPARIAALVLAEGAALSMAGVLLGLPLGMLFTVMLLKGLASPFNPAVAGIRILFHAAPATLVTGVLSAFAASLLAMAIPLRNLLKLQAKDLLSGDPIRPGQAGWKKAAGRGWLVLSGMLLGTAAIAAGTGAGAATGAAGRFFAAGGLLFAGGMVLAAWFLGRSGLTPVDRDPFLFQMALKNTARKPGRSLTVIGLMACACFLVFSVAAMRESVETLEGGRSSGTGGFALYGETTLPLPEDPGTPAGLERLGMSAERLPPGVTIVPVKEGPGDDASCFNLNRVGAPRLLGIDPEAFSRRRAFLGEKGEDLWRLLGRPLPDDTVPGLAGDTDTALWNLRLPVGPEKGAVLHYTNDHGEDLRVKLVGALPFRKTVFQGSVLVSLGDFVGQFPSIEGWKILLVDVPGPYRDSTPDLLAHGLDRYGIDILPAAQRLADFHTVENTYLALFLWLGGLGVILGTLGLGVIVLRNTEERRSELALLAALGFSLRDLTRVMIVENLFLFGLGIFIGTLSSLLAVIPVIRSMGGSLPWVAMAVLWSGLLLTGTISIVFASRGALKEPLTVSLRAE